MEVKIANTADPLGYLMGVLRKLSSILDSIGDSPKKSRREMYETHRLSIEQLKRDIAVGSKMLRDGTLAIGTSDGEERERWSKKLVEQVGQANAIAQRGLNLLDTLSSTYKLPTSDPILFAKIGTILYE